MAITINISAVDKTNVVRINTLNITDNTIVLKILDSYIDNIPCDLFIESENEIRKLLLKYLPPHLKELTQTLAD